MSEIDFLIIIFDLYPAHASFNYVFANSVSSSDYAHTEKEPVILY